MSGRATFLLDVCLDHLSGEARSELTVLSTFEEHRDNNFRIAARRESYEPCVVFVFSTSQGFARLVAHGLRAAGFAGELNALEMGAGCSSEGTGNIGHGAGDHVEILGIDLKVTG